MAQQPQGKIDISTAISHAQKAKGWFDNVKTFLGIGTDTVGAFNNALRWVAIRDLAEKNLWAASDGGEDEKAQMYLDLNTYAKFEAVRSVYNAGTSLSQIESNLYSPAAVSMALGQINTLITQLPQGELDRASTELGTRYENSRMAYLNSGQP